MQARYKKLCKDLGIMYVVFNYAVISYYKTGDANSMSLAVIHPAYVPIA